MRKLYRNLLISTAICLPILSSPLAMIGMSWESITKKETEKVQSKLMSDKLNRSIAKQDEEWTMNGNSSVAANIWSYPTPRYNPIELRGVYSYIRHTSHEYYMQLLHSRGWSNWGTFDDLDVKPYLCYIGRPAFRYEFFNESFYQPSSITNNGDITTFAVNFNSDGSFKVRNINYFSSKKWRGERKYALLWLDPINPDAYPRSWGNGTSRFQKTNRWQNANNNNFYTGISYLKNNKSNLSQQNTYYSKENPNSDLVNQSNSNDKLQSNNTYSYANDGSTILVIKNNDNAYGQFGRRYLKAFHGYFHGFKDDTNSKNPHSMHYQLETNTGSYDFRLGPTRLKSRYFDSERTTKVFMSGTGRNYVGYGNQRESLLSSQNTVEQNAMLINAAGMSSSDANKHNIGEFFTFGTTSENGWVGIGPEERIWASFSSVTPAWYSPSEHKWYYMTDDILFLDHVPIEINLKDDKKNTIKDIWPSDFVNGLEAGKYNNWFNFSTTLSSDWYWTTPSSWWRYYPTYKFSSNNLNGTVTLEIYIPTYKNEKHSVFPSYFYSSSRNLYDFDSVQMRRKQITFSGFKDGVTSFTDYDDISTIRDLMYLASNFATILNSEQRKILVGHFLDNIDKYLNKYDILHLENEDIAISTIDNDLRSGTATLRIQLKEYVTSDYQHVENVQNGIYKDFHLSKAYRINGKTQLNKNIITVPEQYKNTDPTDATITTDLIKEIIINEQQEGVYKTIETNYQDRSGEVFSNYGNLLSLNNDFLTITSIIPNDKTGTIQVNYKLSKTFNTDIDNKNILDQSLEGSILLTGFKGIDSPLYELNSTTPYADKFGMVSWNANTNAITVGNKMLQSQNVTTNEIILSQQYVNSSSTRAVLVYDQNRPDKIIIRKYQADTLKQEYVFDAPWVKAQLASVNDDAIGAESRNEMLQWFDKYELCKANGDPITSNDWMSGKYITANLGPAANSSQSYKVTEDIYAKIPLTTNLGFNKMIPFASDANQKSDLMLIYNSGTAPAQNEVVDETSIQPIIIVDLSKNQPTLKLIKIKDFDRLYTPNVIYAASAYVKYEQNKTTYYVSFIGYNANKKTNFVTVTLDENLNITNCQSKDITQTLNLHPSENVNQVSAATNMYQFKTVIKDNKVKMIGLLNNPSTDATNITRSFYVSEDVFSTGIKKININMPTGSSLSEIQANILTNEYDTITEAFTNWNYSRDMDALYATYKNEDTYAIKIDLNKLMNKPTINVIDETDINIIKNSSLDLKDYVFSLQDNTNLSSIGYDEANQENVNVETKLINGEYTVDESYANTDLRTITGEMLKNMIPAETLKTMFDNYNPNIFDNNEYSFNNLNYDFVNGEIHAQLLLQKNNDINFNQSEKAYGIKVKGFKKNQNATSITLNAAGENYFANLPIDNFESQLLNLARNRQLHQYFDINNHNETSIDEALTGADSIITPINYDVTNNKAVVGFNVKDVTVDNNGPNFFNNYVIYVDVPINLPSFINEDFVLPYSLINSVANITPSQYRDKVISNPNGNEANKLKRAIAESTGLDTIKYSDITLSLDMQFYNGIGELYGTFSIPTLVKYSDKFNNIKFTVNGMKIVESTIVEKREDHFTNIMPSKLQSYLNTNVSKRSLEFIQIGGAKNSKTKVVAAYVNSYDDDAGTATVTFSISNFISGGMNQISNTSDNSTLNATFEFTNLRGTSNDALTTIDSIIETNDSSIIAQEFVERVQQNVNVAINLLAEKNALKNEPAGTRIQVNSMSYDNKNGTVNILWQLDRYIATSGTIISQPIIFTSQITGFKNVTGPTSVSLKETVSTYDYEYLINTIKTDVNFINNIINIENMPDNTQLSCSKIIEKENSADLYVQLDKYYADDTIYSVKSGYEIKLTINKSSVNTVSFHLANNTTSSNNEISTTTNNEFLKNYWYVIVICIGLLSLASVGAVGYWMYAKKIKDATKSSDNTTCIN